MKHPKKPLHIEKKEPKVTECRSSKNTLNEIEIEVDKSIHINHSFNNYYVTIKKECCCENIQFSLISHKFFSKVSNGTVSGSDLQIPATSFVDDNGTAITSFPTSFQYFNLFVNGLLQENGVALVTSSQLIIKGGSSLDKDDPIALEFIIVQLLKGGDDHGCFSNSP